MASSSFEETLSTVKMDLAILHQYIMIKFGQDFKQFYEEEVAQLVHNDSNQNQNEGDDQIQIIKTELIQVLQEEDDRNECIQDFVDIDHSMVTESNSPPNKKRRYKLHDWQRIKTFDNFTSAKLEIKLEGIFTYNMATDREAGRKIYYNCKVPKCPVKMHLLLDAKSQKVHMSTNRTEHVHEPRSQHGLSPKCKEEILRMVQEGYRRPREIHSQLRERGFETPTTAQITRMLTYHRSRTESNTGEDSERIKKNFTLDPDGPERRKRGRPKKAEKEQCSLLNNTNPI